MNAETVEIETRGRVVTDITDIVRRFVARSGGDGAVHVFLPHATAGLAVMETGAGSEEDLERLLDELLPRDDRYAHQHGSRGHGADHLLPALVSPSLLLPVENGRLVLGTWQRAVVVDTNRENNVRTVRLGLLPA